MRIPRCIVLIAALSASFAALGEPNQRTGNFWRSMDQLQQQIYLAGVMDGAELGRDLISMGCYGKQLYDNPEGVLCSVDAQGKFVVGYDKYLQNVSNEQIHDGLNVLFEDYRNRKIRVDDGVFIVLRQIAGDPETDTLINNIRIRAATPN